MSGQAHSSNANGRGAASTPARRERRRFKSPSVDRAGAKSPAMMDIEAMMRRIGVAPSSRDRLSPEVSRQRVAPTTNADFPPGPLPPPLSTHGGSADASVASAKLDLGDIKHAALLRDIQKQESDTRQFVEPCTNNRADMLIAIQKKGREAGERQITEPRTGSRSAMLFEIQKQQHVGRRRTQEPEPEPEPDPEPDPEPEPPVKPERQSKKLKKPPPPSLPVPHRSAGVEIEAGIERYLDNEFQSVETTVDTSAPVEVVDETSPGQLASVECLAAMAQTRSAEVERRHKAEVDELRLENKRLLAELDVARRELSESSNPSSSSTKQATMAAATDIAKNALDALRALEEATTTWSESISSESSVEVAHRQHENVSALSRGLSSSDSRLQVSPRTLCVVFDSPLRERVLLIKRNKSTRPGPAVLSSFFGTKLLSFLRCCYFLFQLLVRASSRSRPISISGCFARAR